MPDSFATALTATCQVLLPMGFLKQEYRSGLPFPSLGHLPDTGIELTSPALTCGFFTTEPSGKHVYIIYTHTYIYIMDRNKWGHICIHINTYICIFPFVSMALRFLDYRAHNLKIP